MAKFLNGFTRIEPVSENLIFLSIILSNATQSPGNLSIYSIFELMAKIQVHYAISASHDLMSTVRPIKLCNWKTTVRIKFLQRTLYLKKTIVQFTRALFFIYMFCYFLYNKNTFNTYKIAQMLSSKVYSSMYCLKTVFFCFLS